MPLRNKCHKLSVDDKWLAKKKEIRERGIGWERVLSTYIWLKKWVEKVFSQINSAKNSDHDKLYL